VDYIQCFDHDSDLVRLVAFTSFSSMFLGETKFPVKIVNVIAVRHRDKGLRLSDSEAQKIATDYLIKSRGKPPENIPVVY